MKPSKNLENLVKTLILPACPQVVKPNENLPPRPLLAGPTSEQRMDTSLMTHLPTNKV
jgi:hypothetical protein